VKTAVGHPDEPRVINGEGPWRITIQNGGVVKIECWLKEDDQIIGYYHAGETEEQ